MADNKNPNEQQPGEKPEGKYHYNPGNQSGKTAEIVPKEEIEKLIDLGLVEMRDDAPQLTVAGQNAVWKD